MARCVDVRQLFGLIRLLGGERARELIAPEVQIVELREEADLGRTVPEIWLLWRFSAAHGAGE